MPGDFYWISDIFPCFPKICSVIEVCIFSLASIYHSLILYPFFSGQKKSS